MRRELQTVLELLHQTADDPPELAVLIGELRQLEATAFSLLVRVERKVPDELLDVGEVAKRTRMSANYIYTHWTKFGGYKEGNRLRFPASALEKFLRKAR